jgi:hypothetical protein
VGLALQIHPLAIRQGFHIQTTTPIPETTSVADVVQGPIRHAAQILPFQLFHATTMCCGGIGTSDPPSGTHKTRLSHPTTHTCPQGRNQCCRRGSGIEHAAQILPFQLFRHHHYVLRWDWHFRSTLWYIRQGFHIQTTHTCPGTHPVSQTWFGANSHIQLKFYRSNCSATTTMCCGGIISDPPSGTIDKASPSNYPTYPRTQPVLQRWFGGQFGTCSSNSTVPIVPPPPLCATVSWHWIHPLVP